MTAHPIDALFATIAARRDADPAASYTAQLIARGAVQCAKKFGEESVETVIAAARGNREELASESADALYHLLVLWAAAGLTPDDIYAVLKGREGRSGLAEKAARGKA
jgi:phosphoribosyl-ATP pyrophosphohydrolase